MSANRSTTLPFGRLPAPDSARFIKDAVPIPDPVAFARALMQLQDLGGRPAEIIVGTTTGERIAIDLLATAGPARPARQSPGTRPNEPVPAVFLDLIRQGHSKEEVRRLFRIAPTNRQRLEQLDQAAKMCGDGGQMRR